MWFAMALTGCTSMPEAAPLARVTGTVGYLQRIALLPSAQVKVQLVDVSRADAPAVVIAEQSFVTEGRQPPFAFELAYDPARIDARHTYAVQARIEGEGKLLFVSDKRYSVITGDAPSRVDVVLRMVGGGTR